MTRLIDRRTERILIARPRVHSTQRGKNLDRSFFFFVTIHAFDRQTDGETDKILIDSLDRVCIPCSAVKTDVIQ